MLSQIMDGIQCRFQFVDKVFQDLLKFCMCGTVIQYGPVYSSLKDTSLSVTAHVSLPVRVTGFFASLVRLIGHRNALYMSKKAFVMEHFFFHSCGKSWSETYHGRLS
jgi:hypothetical protein